MSVHKAHIPIKDFYNNRFVDYLCPYLAPLLFLNLSIYFINNPNMITFNIERAANQEPSTKVTINESGVSEFSFWSTHLNKRFANSKLLTDFETSINGNQFLIEFGTAALFDSGKAQIQEQSVRELIFLSKFIVDNAATYAIDVEAYTDNMPIVKNAHLYPSNWELTGARAARVVRLLTSMGFNPEHIKYTGFGSSRAKHPNTDKNGRPILANQLRNRRLIIRLAKI